MMHESDSDRSSMTDLSNESGDNNESKDLSQCTIKKVIQRNVEMNNIRYEMWVEEWKQDSV